MDRRSSKLAMPVPGLPPGEQQLSHKPRPVDSSKRKGASRKKAEATESIVVAIRIRPIDDLAEQHCRALAALDGQRQVELTPPADRGRDGGPKYFAFDHVFDPSDQQEIFEALGKPALEQALQGFNASVFAYGQTGSGKTHTMMGTEGEPGVIMRVCEGLFTPEFEGWSVEMSFLEIYNEQVIDLLSPTQLAPIQRGDIFKSKAGSKAASPADGWDFVAKSVNRHSTTPKPALRGLAVREHPQFGVYVEGLVRVAVESAEDVDNLLAQGSKMRAVAATNMNSSASRSHAVVQVFVAEGGKGERVAQLNLVDLAGSENTKRAHTSGSRLREGQNINKSLFTLGQCITILAGKDGYSDFATKNGDEARVRMATHSNYVPYRDSTLTWILKECLGGNSKTCMLCTLSADKDNYEQTLSTLKYADNAKNIKTKPIINQDLTKMVIQKLQSEIKDLAMELRAVPLSAPLISSFATQTAMSRMGEAQELLNMMNVLIMTRAEKLDLAEKLNQQRKKMLEELGISMESSRPVMRKQQSLDSSRFAPGFTSAPPSVRFTSAATPAPAPVSSATTMTSARMSADDTSRSRLSPAHRAPPSPPRRPAPFLTNLSADPQQTGKLVFYLKSGFTLIGREMADSAELAPDFDTATPRSNGPFPPRASHCIVLNSNAIRPRHARVHNANGICSIAAERGAAVFINGKLLASSQGTVFGRADEEAGHVSPNYVLQHGDRVILGSHHVFAYQQPYGLSLESETESRYSGGEGEGEVASWQEAIAELEQKRSFDVGMLMFQAYLSDELGSILDGEMELFTDANALNDLTERDFARMGADISAPAQFLTQTLRTALVVLAAANLWFEFFSLLSLKVNHPLELVISAEMLALFALLLGGLTSVKVALWAVPALMHNSTLVFLETLAGAYEASRSARAGQTLGQLFGISLFFAGVAHAAWTSELVREQACEMLGSVLFLPPSDFKSGLPSRYVRFEDRFEEESDSSTEFSSADEPPPPPARHLSASEPGSEGTRGPGSEGTHGPGSEGTRGPGAEGTREAQIAADSRGSCSYSSNSSSSGRSDPLGAHVRASPAAVPDAEYSQGRGGLQWAC